MRLAVRLLAGVALFASATALRSQDTGTSHDAPYIPSPRSTVDEMLRLGEVSASDVVYDLGAGDGRVVIEAARKFGARGVGIELDPKLVAASRKNAELARVADRVRFVQQDLFQADLNPATVIMLYLSPNLNLRLRPALLKLKPGTRIVSHASDLGDWKADRTSAIRKDVRVWLVPAAVSGRWSGSAGGRALQVDITQRYQQISADAVLGGAPVPVWEAKLESDRIRFVIVDALDTDDEAGLYFEGRVSGSVIEGSIGRSVGSARRAESWRVEKK